MWENFLYFDDVRREMEEKAQIKISAAFRGHRKAIIFNSLEIEKDS